GDGLVIDAQPSQQTPDGASNAAAPIDTPPTEVAPAPQPPVDSPAPETPPTAAPPAPETTPPVSVAAQRTSEIASLEASGQFNRSQASPDAPRTPLEKTFQQQGEQNGKLTNVVDLGSPWPNRELAKPAAEAFVKLNDAFKAQFGHDIVLNDAYRNYDKQVATKKDAVDNNRPEFAATPGFSKHGWGLAIDMGGGMQSFDSNEAQWMMDNALNYGWNHPAFAAPGTSAPEPWHWEYVLPL
ncbi:MAG: M15 family metallopeptidase, partial [Candidatus Saccharibacteria bacterium]